MTPTPDAEGSPECLTPAEPTNAIQPTGEASPVKLGKIFDADDDGFGLEYDNTRGQKNTMRLDALTYEGAIREARSFLEIQENDCDAAGDRWTVE